MVVIVLILLLSLKGIAQTDTSAILISFNEPMRGPALINKTNYKVTDPNNVRITVYKVKVVPSDSSKVVLFCKRINYKQTHKVVVSNVKDRAGNLIDPLHNKASFIFEGITNNMNTPVAGLRK